MECTTAPKKTATSSVTTDNEEYCPLNLECTICSGKHRGEINKCKLSNYTDKKNTVIQGYWCLMTDIVEI